MKLFILLFILFASTLVFADSPGSNVIKAKTFNGDGTQGIGSILDALKVNLTNSSVPVTGAFYQAVQPVSVASSLAVTGQFYQATQPVSIAAPVAVTGQFYPATQPVSGPLTNSELRATPLQVTGALVSNGLTDTQLRASPLTVNIGSGGSDATASNQLVNIGVLNGISAKIPGNLTVTAQNNLKVDSSGSTAIISNFPATQAISAAALPLPGGASTADLQTAGNAILTNINQKVPQLGQALASASVPIVLTQAQLATLTPLTSVGVNNFPANQSVTVTNFPSSQTVSGTVIANAGTNLNTSLLALDATVAKDASVNSLLKPSSTLAAVTTLGSVTNTVTVKADALANQTNAFKVDGSATTQPVSAATLPLPIGAATSAAQTTGNASVASIDTKLTTSAAGLKVDGSAVTQPVSIAGTVAVSNASLPLPAGASTLSAQTTGNNSLASIDTKTPALGQALAASSVPVVLTAAQLSTLTPLTSVSVNNFPASQAVTGTFFQSTQPVSAAALPLPSGAATSALQTSGNASIASQLMPMPGNLTGNP